MGERNVNGAGGWAEYEEWLASGKTRIRGKYWLTVELPDGKKQTVHKTAPNGKEAQRRLEKWKSDVARDEYDSPAAEKLTVNDIFDHYERYMEREGIKSRSFPSMIRYMRSKFGKVPALRLTTKRVEKFEEEEKAWRKARRERLDEERRARGMHVRDYGFPPPEVVTVQNYLACLRAAYRHAAKGKPPLIRNIPFAVSFTEPKNALRGFFETEEWDAVRGELANPPECERDGYGRIKRGFTNDPRAKEKGFLYGDLCDYGYLTGCRREEAEALEWTQVDEDAGEIRLSDTKSGEPRLIVIEDERLAAIIERRRAAREWKDSTGVIHISPLVFHLDGKPVPDFRKAWYSACARAGVFGKKPFHDFRRSAARDGIRAGVPQRVMQQQLGHETASMFDRYHIVSKEDLRAAAKATAEYRRRQRQRCNVRRLALKAKSAGDGA